MSTPRKKVCGRVPATIIAAVIFSKQLRHQAAIDYARRWLTVESYSWTEQGGTKWLGIGASKREDERRYATAGIKDILDNIGDPDIASFKEIARKRYLPALERPVTNQRGQRTDSYLPRYRLIATTVGIICRKFGYFPTRNPATENRDCGCSIVAEALRRNGVAFSEKRVKRIWEKHRRGVRAGIS